MLAQVPLLCPSAVAMNVSLSTMGGRSLEANVPIESTATDLKTLISNAWNIPLTHQELVLGSEKLLDFQSIEWISERAMSCNSTRDGDKLQITVITSTMPFAKDRNEELLRLIAGISDRDSLCRRNAVSLLMRTIDVTNERELEFFVHHMGELLSPSAGPSENIQRAALGALGKISPLAHDESIKVAARSLKNPSYFVRLTAAETVKALAPRGHAATVSSACALLKKASDEVKVTTMILLGGIAKEDSKEVLPLLTKMSDSRNEELSLAAGEAVTEILRAAL